MSSVPNDKGLRELIRATRVFIWQISGALADFAGEVEKIEKALGVAASAPSIVPFTAPPIAPPIIEQTQTAEQDAQQMPDIYSVKSVSGSDTSLSSAAEKVLVSQVGALEEGMKAKQGARLKIALAGRAAVGKTTLFNLLKGLASPAAYHATIGADVDRKLFQIDGTRVIIWDLAGQQEYHKTWVIFLRGAALILFVTDSTVENVVGSKPLLDLCHRVEPKAQIICIANKQDLPGRLKPEEIERQLGVKTFGCVAIDPVYRDSVMNVIVQSVRRVVSKGQNPLDQES
ncbi:MAG: GTP-binding protein [Promethearchaeati archaeon SRVP18_Atabeyarchaeia-1]